MGIDLAPPPGIHYRAMAEHEKFHYAELSDLKADVDRLGLDLPLAQDVSVLKEPTRLGRHALANRLMVHPMEGCDGTLDGAPAELTLRRCDRWASGGAGLIWFEATAIVPEGRASPRQLWLHEASQAGFEALVARIRRIARDNGGEPVIVIQLTHSGRYSRPKGPREPIIAQHNPTLDALYDLPPDYPLISDAQLDALPEAYAKAAKLAADAGFDGVDIKACHRYLVNELLAAYTRLGRYGGAYENRTRLLREAVAAVRSAVGDRLEIACRMNVYDGLPWPCGWGVGSTPEGTLREAAPPVLEARRPSQAAAEEHGLQASRATRQTRLDKQAVPPATPATRFVPPPRDLSEPLRLIGQLVELGLTCLSVTGGNPYFRPHLNRPADAVETNAPPPPEHPLEGVARLVQLARQVQQAFPDLPVVGAGYSWLRQFGPNLASGAVGRGWATLLGLGRGALAYPDFARDLVSNGRLEPGKVCIACGKCSQIMRDGGQAGCVVRDAGVYGPIYQAGRRGRP